MSNAKIAKLEAKVNEIMARPTYSVTPAWQAEVAEIRVQVEAIRTGQDVERREYNRPTIHGGGGAALAAAGGATIEADHDDSDHHAPYMAIFLALLVLTVLEWKCDAWFGLKGTTLWSALTIMALVKAVMVAMFFMHMKFERKTFHLLAIIPIVLIILMLALVSPDTHQHLLQYLRFLQ